MKRKTYSWVKAFALLLVLILMTPSLGQPKEEREAGSLEMQREKLVKELNLSPDKAKEFLAVGEKYHQIRQDVIGRIKKSETDLTTALAAPQPDESKINQIVTALIADHLQLFETFKAQRHEEMGLLTPVQRGKFLLALKKWHETVAQKEEK
jgi:Spy/CpxP family protein refolding chaperone